MSERLLVFQLTGTTTMQVSRHFILALPIVLYTSHCLTGAHESGHNGNGRAPDTDCASELDTEVSLM